MERQFFATSQEQIRVISRWYDCSNLQFILRDWRKEQLIENLVREDIDQIDFSTDRDFGLKLLILNKLIRPEVIYRTIPGRDRREVDLVKSGMVEMSPCIRSGDALFMGRIAIMGKEWCREEEWDYLELKRWFQALSKDLAREWPPCTLWGVAENGAKSLYRGMLLSPGALEWVQSGGYLKQFIKGKVHFTPAE